MYYEINVAKKDSKGQYRHYFATAPRSLTFYKEAIKVLKHFIVLFPAPEYNMTVNKNPEQFSCSSPEDFL